MLVVHTVGKAGLCADSANGLTAAARARLQPWQRRTTILTTSHPSNWATCSALHSDGRILPSRKLNPDVPRKCWPEFRPLNNRWISLRSLHPERVHHPMTILLSTMHRHRMSRMPLLMATRKRRMRFTIGRKPTRCYFSLPRLHLPHSRFCSQRSSNRGSVSTGEHHSMSSPPSHDIFPSSCTGPLRYGHSFLA